MLLDPLWMLMKAIALSVCGTAKVLRTMSSLVEINYKRVELSLQKKCKGTRKKALEKAADPAMKDCTNSLNKLKYCSFVPPVSSPECERAAKV